MNGEPPAHPVLVIGYGNTLRGDDGAGVIAAGRARDLLAGLDVITAHQLQPEHAEAVAGHRCVIFVDASVRRTALGITDMPAGVGWRSAGSPATSPGDGMEEALPQMNHSLSPAGVLALARTVFGATPDRALLLEIPALSMEFGDGLTPQTSAGVEQSLAVIREEMERSLHHV